MARSSQESSSVEKRGSLLFPDELSASSPQGDSSANQSEPEIAEKKAKKTRKSSKKEASAPSGLFDLGAPPVSDNLLKDEVSKDEVSKDDDLKDKSATDVPNVPQSEIVEKAEPVEEPPSAKIIESAEETPSVEITENAEEIESAEETPSFPSETDAANDAERGRGEEEKSSKIQQEQEQAEVEGAPKIELAPDPVKSKPGVFEEPSTSGAIASSSKRPSAYQVVARRYRPQTFEELIGQSTVVRALSNAIETDRVGHAYLFTGARGVGKTSCARIFAKALNCVEGPTTKPCLKCDSCLGIATGDDVDVIEIDGASNRGVDEIRQLRQNATIAPSRSLYKIYIIDEVHMLTREAFNALLKTLEEPPARVKFIFCTTEPNKIPITILSRCQRFDFGGINGASIAERLATIAAQEGAQAEEGVFEILARRANGSMRDAQSLLEQLLSFAPTYISQTDVHNMLGSVDDEKIFQLLDATIKSDVARIFESLGQLASSGVDFGVLVEQTLGIFRDLMVVSSGCGAKELMYAPVGRFEELQEIAQTLGARRILASLQILDQTSQRMRFSVQSRVLVELAFARLSALDAFQPLEALIEQLRKGTLQIPLNVPNSPASPSLGADDKKKSERPIASTPETRVDASDGSRAPKVAPIANSNARETSAESSNAADSLPDASLSNDASADSSYDVPPWLDLPQEQLCAIWRDATSVGVMLPSQASAFTRVDVEAPNRFTVVFPSDKGVQRQYCEEERNKIAPRLSKILGFEVSLRCLIDARSSDASVPPPRPANSSAYSSRGKYPNRFENRQNDAPRASFGGRRPNIAEIEKNESVRQIKEIFEAELYDVKLPPRPVEKTNAASEPK